MAIKEPMAPGAPAAAGVIPLCVPEIHGNEWRYIKECLDTSWVSSVGDYVDRFETELARRTGRRHAVATASGTSALHLALLLAGVQPDDEVLVSTLTFIAPVNAIRYVGAWSVLIDAEPDYWQMDGGKLAEFLARECEWSAGALRNRTSGRRVRAVLPVHVLGHPADVQPIRDAALRHELTLIEDAAEALGTLYRGRPAGSFGDTACLSFNGNKIITTGGGGALLTDDSRLAARAKYLSTQAKDDPLEYVHHEVGYNYRLTNVQAAMGVAQLEQLDAYVEAKRRIAARYQEALAAVPGIVPMPEAPWALSTFWMFTVLVRESEYGLDSRALLSRLGERGIAARPLWQPLHRSRAHVGCQAYRCEVADALWRDGLSLPCSVGLSVSDQQRVIDAIRDR